MYTNTQKLSAPETPQLRKAAGRLLKTLRERAGHSQSSFSAAIGVPDKTFVSQIENGRRRLPPDQVRLWAAILGVEGRDLMLMLMRFYDPEGFALIFENDEQIFDGSAFPDLIALTSADNVKTP